jgi:hypothetical protein
MAAGLPSILPTQPLKACRVQAFFVGVEMLRCLNHRGLLRLRGAHLYPHLLGQLGLEC